MRPGEILMTRRCTVPCLVALALLMTGVYAHAAETAPSATALNGAARQRLVMQVSDGDAAHWRMVLGNARNVQAALGAANVDIEIVAFGPGLNMITQQSTVKDRVRDSIAAGVRIVACENTMKIHKLTRDDMLPSLDYVEAGIVEVMIRQQQGFIYVRP